MKTKEGDKHILHNTTPTIELAKNKIHQTSTTPLPDDGLNPKRVAIYLKLNKKCCKY